METYITYPGCTGPNRVPLQEVQERLAMQFSHILDLFLGGLITIATLAVLFTAKNTSSVVGALGKATTGSLTAAEAG